MLEYAIVPDKMPDVIDPRDSVVALLLGSRLSDIIYRVGIYRVMQVFFMVSAIVAGICCVLSISGICPVVCWVSPISIPTIIHGILFFNIYLAKLLFHSLTF